MKNENMENGNFDNPKPRKFDGNSILKTDYKNNHIFLLEKKNKRFVNKRSLLHTSPNN
jgi:hypothetical protein